MGDLYLCRQELAAVPYFIEQAGLNIYSLEELSYYIRKQVDFLDQEFLDPELCDWVEQEVKEPSLALEMRKTVSASGSLARFVKLILDHNDYCSEEEVQSVYELLLSYENKTETECRKIQADRLLKKKKYLTCISLYRSILLAEEKKKDSIFCGNIHHNMGVAYAGLFNFEEAERCFDAAFSLNQNELSQKARVLAKVMCQRIESGMKPVSIPEVQTSLRSLELNMDQFRTTVRNGDRTLLESLIEQWKAEMRA